MSATTECPSAPQAEASPKQENAATTAIVVATATALATPPRDLCTVNDTKHYAHSTHVSVARARRGLPATAEWRQGAYMAARAMARCQCNPLQISSTAHCKHTGARSACCATPTTYATASLTRRTRYNSLSLRWPQVVNTSHTVTHRMEGKKNKEKKSRDGRIGPGREEGE